MKLKGSIGDSQGFVENFFRELIKPHLLRCRPGDWEHTLRVVRWVKRLGKGREDLPLLIMAAYLHDIGWRDVLPKGKKLSKEEVKSYGKIAEANSPVYAREILAQLNLSESEIRTILRLIKAADTYKATREDEAIIVDADNLSKLRLAHLRQKYKKSEWSKMVSFWERELPKRIKTKRGKHLYPALLEKLKMRVREDSAKESK